MTLTINYKAMKKLLFLFISVVALISCNNKTSDVDKFLEDARAYNDSISKYFCFSANEKTVKIDIYILDGESEWFDVSILNKSSHSVDFKFYPKQAVDVNGRVKLSWKGNPRFYHVYTPKNEKIIYCGVNGVKLINDAGEERFISFNVIHK